MTPLVLVSGVDEAAALRAAEGRLGTLSAAQVVLVLAQAKCEAVAAAVVAGTAPTAASPTDLLVLGGDSVLELDGRVHGKPADAAEAIARWRAMRGREGVLHTGHWLVDLRDQRPAGAPRGIGATGSTVVRFADLDDAEIAAYVATGEPLGVAGAFCVDGLGGPYVTSIEGDYHNVVGLSLPLLRDLLGQLGIAWHELRRSGGAEPRRTRRTSGADVGT